MAAPVPMPLRREIDADALCRVDPCDSVVVLGSFWPNTRNSFESHVVKSFKECAPVRSYQPHISALCRFYADLILRAAGQQRFDWVVRVLSSCETAPDPSRPQSLLVESVCSATGARASTDFFFKSASRPSMRTVSRLSGPDALRARAQYVLQDLFIRPVDLGGRVLLIDDIFNTGASMRVYARALKDYGGVEEVHGVNLAATRFHGGRDGQGMLKLDLSGLEERYGLTSAWLDSGGVYHRVDFCPAVKPPISQELAFMCEKKSSPCPACACQQKPARRWWAFWRMEQGRR